MSTAVSITDPDQLAMATIRTLCIDAVRQANSGHPGTPMAMAPVASVVGIAKEWLAAAGSG